MNKDPILEDESKTESAEEKGLEAVELPPHAGAEHGRARFDVHGGGLQGGPARRREPATDVSHAHDRLRAMLQSRWSAEAWSVVRFEFKRSSYGARSGARTGSTRLVTAPSACRAGLVRVVAFG